MGKAPAFQFYPNDWTRDMEEFPLEMEGAWIRICCKLWWSETKGRLTRTLDEWGRILRVDNPTADRIIKTIEVKKIGDVTVCSKNITVTNRRMHRDHKEKELNRLRQEKWRGIHKCDKEVTPLSSSSSSTSLKRSPAPPDLVKKRILDGTHGDKCDAIILACKSYLDLGCTHAQAGKINKKAESVGQAIIAVRRVKKWLTSKKDFMGAVIRDLSEARGSTDKDDKRHPGWPDADWDSVKQQDDWFEKDLDKKYGNKLGDVIARMKGGTG